MARVLGLDSRPCARTVSLVQYGQEWRAALLYSCVLHSKTDPDVLMFARL